MMHLADRKIAVIAVFCIIIALCAVFWGFSDGAVGATGSVDAQGRSDVQRLEVTSQLSETLLFTHSVYLPFVAKSSLPLTETLKSKYVFVEMNTVVEYSESCWSAAMASLPIYFFNPYEGILTIYPPNPALKLQPDDMGYIGRWIAGGGYYGNSIQKFQHVPFSGNGLTLNAVNDDGTVSLEYMTMTLTLSPGTEWLRHTV